MTLTVVALHLFFLYSLVSFQQRFDFDAHQSLNSSATNPQMQNPSHNISRTDHQTFISPLTHSTYLPVDLGRPLGRLQDSRLDARVTQQGRDIQ